MGGEVFVVWSGVGVDNQCLVSYKFICLITNGSRKNQCLPYRHWSTLIWYNLLLFSFVCVCVCVCVCVHVCVQMARRTLRRSWPQVWSWWTPASAPCRSLAYWTPRSSLLETVRPLVCLSVCLSIYQSIHPSIYPSIHLSIYQSIDLSIYLSICPSIHPCTPCIYIGWLGGWFTSHNLKELNQSGV